MTTEATVSASGLVKAFGEFRAVDGIDLEVRQGEIFGVLGPNGAGKTTTLRCLLGLVRPTSGEALLGGRQIGRASCRERV